MGTLGGIPLDVGDVLAKKYRLERLVGEGGTGVVVAARHLQLERDVAIKFLRTALASDEVRLRFERWSISSFFSSTPSIQRDTVMPGLPIMAGLA